MRENAGRSKARKIRGSVLAKELSLEVRQFFEGDAERLKGA